MAKNVRMGEVGLSASSDFYLMAEPGPFCNFRQEPSRSDLSAARGIFWAAVFSIPLWFLVIGTAVLIFR
jgi:hypothetical protein